MFAIVSAHAFVYSVSFYSNWGNPSQAQWHHPHPTDISCSATISVDNHCFYPFTKPSQWVRRASRCGSIHYPNFVSLFGLELHFTTSELLSRLKCLSTGEYWWNFLFYSYCFVLFQSVWPFEHCKCDQSNVIWGKLKLAFTEQLYMAVFFSGTKWCSNIPLTSTQSISRFPLWKLLGIEMNKYINKCIYLFIWTKQCDEFYCREQTSMSSCTISIDFCNKPAERRIHTGKLPS